jgi:hypothetical protein
MHRNAKALRYEQKSLRMKTASDAEVLTKLRMEVSQRTSM